MELQLLSKDTLEGTLELCEAFHKESAYALPYDKEYTTNFLTNAMKQENFLCLLAVDLPTDKPVGMLVAVAVQHPFYPVKVASELSWYVSPEYRGQKSALEMLRAYEYWAQNVVKADVIQMVSLEHVNPDKLDKVYKHLGYDLKEHTYLKELK